MYQIPTRKLWPSLFVLVAIAALASSCGQKTETQKLQEKAKTSAEEAKDAIKDAASKTGVAVKDAAGVAWDATKEGAQKAGAFTTNIVGEIKEKLN